MLGAVYVLVIVGFTLMRAMRGAVDVSRGFLRYRRSARVDWNARLGDLDRAMDGLPVRPFLWSGFRAPEHAPAVARAREDPGAVMRPSTLLHAVVVAAYNEPYDVVADEYALAPDRARQSFQPISLYITNIWEAPAPSRVVASANCFWNLTTTVRPLALRKFASHSQPLTALIDMGFWSTKTIVEDGHQHWRSWFHFDGDYRVVPIHVPIYQDAVLAGGFKEMMVAQFKQLSCCIRSGVCSPVAIVSALMSQRRSPLVLAAELREASDVFRPVRGLASVLCPQC